MPTPRGDWALFLDFDGTLADIAVSPCAVRVDPRLRPTLAALADALDGAVALVSGRPIAQLDALLSPLVVAAAGQHGLERRRTDGTVTRVDVPTAALERVSERLQTFSAVTPGVLFEDKGLALALHFRGAPERAEACRQAVDAALAAAADRLQVLAGKMVLEIKPAGGNKGAAIEAFMAEPPFAGRLPVFAGDDRTDEDGFVAVERMGGVAIRVGDGAPTAATRRVDSVNALLAWLADVPAAIAGDGSGSGRRRRGDDG
ncbi:MAG: trehalose-phosphatase [Alphaproteobacteria bacterium]